MSCRRITNLAIRGAAPAFREPLHVGRPHVVSRENFLRRVNEMLDRNWFSNDGPFVQEFERKLAERLGVKHCVAVTNGTLALELLLQAAELSGEVIVPSFTFIATVHAILRQGLTPVFCDIHPDTACLDPSEVERRITPRTSAIMGVHCWGRACPVEALQEIATRRGLALFYDASHAFGNTCRGRMIGSFGKAEVFSLHCTKFLHCFEGGAITTEDDDLNLKLRLMRNFGFSAIDHVVSIGTNAKMSEVAAAMGLTSLEDSDHVAEINNRNRRLYEEALRDLPGVSLFPFDAAERQNHQYVAALIDPARAGLTRDVLLRVLRAENVLARRYFYPGCHRMEPYRTMDPNAGQFLPQTERLTSAVLVLPTGEQLNSDGIAIIGEIIASALEDAEALSSELNAG